MSKHVAAFVAVLDATEFERQLLAIEEKQKMVRLVRLDHKRRLRAIELAVEPQ